MASDCLLSLCMCGGRPQPQAGTLAPSRLYLFILCSLNLLQVRGQQQMMGAVGQRQLHAGGQMRGWGSPWKPCSRGRKSRRWVGRAVAEPSAGGSQSCWDLA